DPVTHRVAAAGETINLGPTEFRLLHYFMTHPERVHSRTQLLDGVWGDHVFVEERTVDVHVRRLRSALEPSGTDSLIQTVRGAGSRLSASQYSLKCNRRVPSCCEPCSWRCLSGSSWCPWACSSISPWAWVRRCCCCSAFGVHILSSYRACSTGRVSPW